MFDYTSLFLIILATKTATSLAPTGYKCPDELTVGWMDTPPYISTDKNGSLDGGFLVDIMEDAFNKCCRNNITIVYIEKVTGYSGLIDLTLNSSLDMIIPIRAAPGKDRFLTFPFVEVAQSPGAVLYDTHANSATNAVKNTILANVPLVGLLLVWMSIFGVCFWIFEIIPNQCGKERSCKEMIHEIFEGIWWSFITLATVGYGDILPSRICSRILCYIWLLCSCVTIAIYTATVTSILIKECFGASLEIKGSKIGVVDGSNEHKLVLKNNGLPEMYQDIDDLIHQGFHHSSNAGGLVELYQASYYEAYFQEYRIQTVIEDVKSFGVVLRTRTVKLQSCLKQRILESQREIYERIREQFPPLKTNFSKTTSEETSQSLLVPTAETMRNSVIAVVSAILVLCGIGILREKFFLLRRQKSMKETIEDFALLHEIKGSYHKNLQITMNQLKDDITDLHYKLNCIMEDMKFRMKNTSTMFRAKNNNEYSRK